jgi:hypothetical protein
VADRDQGRHVEHGAHLAAAAPDRVAASHQAAVASERRDADQRRDGVAIELAELGQKREQRGKNPSVVLRCLSCVTPRRTSPRSIPISVPRASPPSVHARNGSGRPQ